MHRDAIMKRLNERVQNAQKLSNETLYDFQQALKATNRPHHLRSYGITEAAENYRRALIELSRAAADLNAFLIHGIVPTEDPQNQPSDISSVKKVVGSGGPGVSCALCADLMLAALKASQVFHHVLESLESAHIRNDNDGAFDFQAQVEGVTLTRNNAVAALREHERTHAKAVSK
jgi:hypothetical protein